MKEGQFYVIIAGGDRRLMRHQDKEAADAEATRLATANPNKKFFICRAERVARVAKPVPPVVIEETDPDPIPF